MTGPEWWITFTAGYALGWVCRSLLAATRRFDRQPADEVARARRRRQQRNRRPSGGSPWRVA